MLGNFPIAGQPLAGVSENSPAAATTFTIDEVIPRIAGTVTTVIVMSGYVFAGTAAPTFVFNDQPLRPPVRAPRSVQRPYDAPVHLAALIATGTISEPSRPLPRPIPTRIPQQANEIVFPVPAPIPIGAITGPSKPLRPIQNRIIPTQEGQTFFTSALPFPASHIYEPVRPLRTAQTRIIPNQEGQPFVTPPVSGATMAESLVPYSVPGVTNTIFIPSSVFIGAPPPAPPVFVDSVIPFPVAGPENLVRLTGTVGVFFNMAYDFGWAETSRPQRSSSFPRIIRPFDHVHLSTAVTPIYNYGWEAIPKLPQPSPNRVRILRPFEHVFLSAPIPPTYNYGWEANTQRPRQLKPSNARNLAPDIHILRPGNTYNYGWDPITQRPRQLKPSNARNLAPDVHLIRPGTTYDYGWANIPRLPRPLPPSNARRIQPDYFTFLSERRTLITGIITDPAGNPATSGYVLFKLMGGLHEEQFYRTIDGAVILNKNMKAYINSTGHVVAADLVSPFYIYGNDRITPSGSWYQVKFAPNGVVSQITNFIYISGTIYDITSPVFI